MIAFFESDSGHLQHHSDFDKQTQISLHETPTYTKFVLHGTALSDTGGQKSGGQCQQASKVETDVTWIKHNGI